MNILTYLKLWFQKLFATAMPTPNKVSPRLFRNLKKEEKQQVINRINELRINPELTMKDITKIVNHEFNLNNAVASFSNTLHRAKKANKETNA